MEIYFSLIISLLFNLNPIFAQQLFTHTNVKKANKKGSWSIAGIPGYRE